MDRILIRKHGITRGKCEHAAYKENKDASNSVNPISSYTIWLLLICTQAIFNTLLYVHHVVRNVYKVHPRYPHGKQILPTDRGLSFSNQIVIDR